MDTRGYFRLRCENTLDVLQNMVALYDDLYTRTTDPRLMDLVKQHHESLREETERMAAIVGRQAPKGKAKPTEERLVVVGQGWVGIIETHRVFAAQISPSLIDINTALIDEEVAHFNQGNYTGLIVLAKQLGEMEIAQMLQASIDQEYAALRRIEDALWWIVGALEGEQRKAA